MKQAVWRTVASFLFCFALALGGTGCASTAMKGTPFFSGEYGKRLGPPEERVNLWPILYYREPALSVLWPLIDCTDDYFAFRPLFSVYGMDRARQEYNVLWPLMHFEEGNGDNWVLPFFWGDRSFFGDNYVVGFPLYWHFGHPLLERGGMDSLFPLWCYRTERDGYDLHLAWPFIEIRALGTEPRRKEGGRIWPLYGSYRERDEHYRFLGWPLAQFWWNEKRDESTQCVLPLWYSKRESGHSLFLSLPYSKGSQANGRSWWLVPPLAYHDSDTDNSRLITPLYWQGRNRKAGSAWDMLLPVYYSQRGAKEATFATLLGGYARRGDASGWFAVPALSGGWYGAKGGSTWWLGGLGFRGSSETRRDWHVFPLCRSVTDSNRWYFLSLPWSGGETDRGTAWSMVPPVWFRSRGDSGNLTVTPLYFRGSEAGGEHRQWSALMPLYYRRTSDRGTAFATPIGGIERDKRDGSSWMLYPLLTGGRLKGDDVSVWVLGPMFHAEWDGKIARHHLFPIYYWNGTDGTFVSLPYSQWGTKEARLSVVPPLLSVYSRRTDRSDFWTAAGLAHWSWGREAGTRHVLPLYIGDEGKGWHVTPAFASWKYGADGHGMAVPPLLSWYTSLPRRADLWMIGPLARLSWGENRGGSHVLPLAYWNTRTATYLSPLYATWAPGPEAKRSVIPPALGYYERIRDERDLWLGLGLFHSGVTQGKTDSGRGHMFPFYLYDHGMFLTPAFGWNSGDGSDFVYPLTPLLGFWRNENSGMWLFPLFSRRHDIKNDSVTGNVLWGIYRSERDSGRFAFFPLFSHHRWNPYGTNGAVKAGQSEGFDTSYLLWLGRRFSEHSVRNRLVIREGSKPVSVFSDYRESRNRLFPFWARKSQSWNSGEEATSDMRFLLFVYDQRLEHRAAPPKGEPKDYVRSRVLYRLLHYERMDDAVSVDVFPAITYDRRGESVRKFSFLWRGFRYERSQGQRAVDLLFLPIWRTKWAGGERIGGKGSSGQEQKCQNKEGHCDEEEQDG